MNQFQACVKKDISEFLRYHRNILCMLVLMGIGAMVLVTTVIFPGLISQLAVKAPDMITDPEAINELMAKLFPQDVKGSLKIFSSDVGVFYTIAVCLICHSILPGEIKNGRWLIPVNAGIEKRTLLTSKCFVYICTAECQLQICDRTAEQCGAQHVRGIYSNRHTFKLGAL